MRVRVSPYLVVVFAALVVAGCSKSSGPSAPGTSPRAATGASAALALDPQGFVQATVSVTHPAGPRLTVNAGTQVVFGDGLPPSTFTDVSIDLAATMGAAARVPAGVAPVGQLTVSVHDGGTARPASLLDPTFDPAALLTAGPLPARPAKGLVLAIPVTADQAPAGAVGMLFDPSAPGTPVQLEMVLPVATSGGAIAAGVTASAAATAAAGQELTFHPSGTGDLSAGTAAAAAPGGSPPASGYSARYPIVDPGCINVGGVDLCGPYAATIVTIGEPSTSEMIGSCIFTHGGPNVVTRRERQGYSYTCVRTQGASGETIEITIHSAEVANLPVLAVGLADAVTGAPRWTIGAYAADGLHLPDGSTSSDPYARKGLEFAGSKNLTFKTKENRGDSWLVAHALQPFVDAGFSAVRRPTAGGTMTVQVDTLTGRADLEDVVTPLRWKVAGPPGTKGNRGAFDLQGRRFRGTASSVQTMPYTGTRIWEVSTEVTFEYDQAHSTETHDWFRTTGGTATETSYVSDPSGLCVSTPSTITVPYPVLPGDGYLWVSTGGSPTAYGGTALITGAADQPYTECCTFPTYSCTAKTLRVNQQQHDWLWTGTVDPTTSSSVFSGSAYRSSTYTQFDWRLVQEDL